MNDKDGILIIRKDGMAGIRKLKIYVGIPPTFYKKRYKPDLQNAMLFASRFI